MSAGLSTAFGEAAKVCLDRHHRSPIDVIIVGPDLELATVAEWEPCDTRTVAAWANFDEATEYGAYAICLAAVEAGVGLVAIQRAENRSGADYYIAPPNTPTDDLEGWLRLEISGVDNGDTAAIRQRLREKIEQTRNGRSNLPAIAAVVGFRAKRIALSERLKP